MDLIKDGKRLDGRAPDELRPIKIEAGPLYRADGSCYLEWGGNKVVAAVYGPKEALPRHIQDSTKAVVNARYNMASFSVEDRKRPGPDRRSQEISKITSEALENVILTEMFPRAMIDVCIEVLDAEAGTRCAGITAAAVALADAGIPMRDIPVACAAGKVDGVVVLDLVGEEDKKCNSPQKRGYTAAPDGRAYDAFRVRRGSGSCAQGVQDGIKTAEGSSAQEI